MRKPDFCIGENKGADQLRSKCAYVFATQIVKLVFIKSEISSFYQSSVAAHCDRLFSVRPGRKP